MVASHLVGAPARRAPHTERVNKLLQQVVLPSILNGYSEVSGTKAFVEALGHFACGPSRQPFFPVPRETIDRERRQVEESFPQFLK